MFFTQFGLLFSNMQWYVIICLCVGIALLILEIFQPGFGIFGIMGIVLLILSIILRTVYCYPEDKPVVQAFQMVLLLFIILSSAFALFIIGNKKNWWKNTAFIQNSTAVNTYYSDGTDNYSHLIDKVGVALTDLKPVGKMSLDGKIYDVVAENFFIESGKNIKITAVEGVKITVINLN